MQEFFMNYNLGVYGDSIAYGYGNNNKSWFDMLSSGVSAIKLAQNGENISEVLKKICNDENNYQTLIIAVGINDLLQVSQNPQDLLIMSLVAQYEEVLKIAKAKADKIIIQSVLPIREELFPHQDWLDCEKWAFNINAIKFNQNILNLTKKHGLIYLDTYNGFKVLQLSEFYIDAVHLNEQGQQNLFREYEKLV